MQWWRGQDSSEAYWALAFLLSVVAIAVVANWLHSRWPTGHSVRRRLFDAGAVADDLAQRNPTAGALVAFRDGDGAECSVDEEPVLFLHRDGALLRKGKTFYLAAAGDKQALLRSLRRQRIARVEFGARGAARSVEVRAVGRKRLPTRSQRLVDEEVSTCWQVVAVGPLQDEQDRALVRYYLQNPGGESVSICSYIRFRLFVYAVEGAPREEAEMDAVALRAYRSDAGDSSQLDAADAADAASTAVAQVHADLQREGLERVWLAKLTVDGERRPLGFYSVLGLQQEEKKNRLKLRCKWRTGGEEDAIDKGDDLVLGYACGSEQKELLARVTQRRGRGADLDLLTLPRCETGLPAEVVDFSATGMRLAIPADGLDYFAGDMLEGRIVAISAYPQFKFPDKAQDYAPQRLAKIELLGRIERVVEEDEQAVRYIGVRFVYEPLRYDVGSGSVLRWRSLRDWEAKPLLDIHRALNRLYGFLHSDMPASDA